MVATVPAVLDNSLDRVEVLGGVMLAWGSVELSFFAIFVERSGMNV